MAQNYLGPLSGLGAALGGFDSGLQRGMQTTQQAALNKSEIQKNQAYGDWMEQRNSTGIAEAALRGLDPALIRAASTDTATAAKLGAQYGLTPGQVIDYAHSIGSNQPVPGYPGSDGMPTPLNPSPETQSPSVPIPTDLATGRPLQPGSSGAPSIPSSMPTATTPQFKYAPPMASPGTPQIGEPSPSSYPGLTPPMPTGIKPGNASPMPGTVSPVTSSYLDEGPQKGGSLATSEQRADNGTVTANSEASRASTYSKIGDADVKHLGAQTQTIMANLPFIAPTDAAKIALINSSALLKKVAAQELPPMDAAKEGLYKAQTEASQSTPSYRQALIQIAQGNLQDRSTLLNQTLQTMGITDQLSLKRIQDIDSKDQDGSFKTALNTISVASKALSDPLTSAADQQVYNNLLSSAVTVVASRLGQSSSTLDTGTQPQGPISSSVRAPSIADIRPLNPVLPNGLHQPDRLSAGSAVLARNGKPVTLNGKQYSAVEDGPYLKLFNADGSYSGHYITKK